MRELVLHAVASCHGDIIGFQIFRDEFKLKFCSFNTFDVPFIFRQRVVGLNTVIAFY